jgi:hypothetical protein
MMPFITIFKTAACANARSARSFDSMPSSSRKGFVCESRKHSPHGLGAHFVGVGDVHT